MYKKLIKERVAYVDCDDTLILWEPNKYKHNPEEVVNMHDEWGSFPVLPHKLNIEFVKKLKTQGYGIIIWSAAGAEWAERVVQKLGLEEIADFVTAKPEIALDDLLDATRIIKAVVWIDPNTGDYKRNV
jgi:FMN phosphatase YigB (HAD superfamily)